jgi:CRISP-associated protein Cas1
MIKRTIVLSNQAYIKKENNQLVIQQTRQKDGGQGTETKSVPIEDIGILMIESHQCTITEAVISALMENNAVVISCNAAHHPDGMMIPFAGNTLHTAVLKDQMRASMPLRKQLWQQTMKAKITNQSTALAMSGINTEPLEYWSRKVRSGDPDNYEGRAAAYYWKNFFPGDYGFTRDPEGMAPNGLLNYGYTILRAATARAIVGSGLHPAIGLFHKSQYNPFCLADDLMEPYRPFVDLIVRKLCSEHGQHAELTPETKKPLLALLGDDVWIEEERKPLLLGLTSTSSSLVKCFAKELNKLSYPALYAPERV